MASCALGDLLTVKHAHGEAHLFGMIQTHYANFEDDEVASTFVLRRARLGAHGQVYEKVYFLFEAHLSQKPMLLDANVTLKFIPHLDLRFGQQWKPVTWEASHSTRTLPFIGYSLPTAYFMANKVCFMDIGARAALHFEKDDFTVFLVEGGVFNGTGINQNDNNDQKDWVIRTAIQPIKGITFIGNYMYGTYGAKAVPDTDPLFGHEGFQQYSAGMIVDYHGLDFATEWIGMNREYIHNKANSDHYNHAWDTFGLYAHLGYRIDTGLSYFHEVEPIARYEYLDRNREVTGDLQRALTYGLNVAIDRHYARLQLNYIWNINDSCPHDPIDSPFGKQADNVFLVQLQAVF